MKSFKNLHILVFIVLTLGSCEKDADPSNNVYGSGNGQVAFWARSTFNVGTIDVLVDNVTIGTVTQYHPNGTTCDDANAKKILTAGTHTYQVIAQNGYTATGTFNISEGQCTLVEIPAPLDFLPRMSGRFGADSMNYQGSQITVQNHSNGCDQYLIYSSGFGLRLYKASPDSWIGSYMPASFVPNECYTVKSFVLGASSYFNQMTGAVNVTYYDPTTRRISGNFSTTMTTLGGAPPVNFTGVFSNIVLP